MSPAALSQLLHFKLAANACGTVTGVLPSLYDGLPCTNGTPQITSLQQGLLLVTNVVRLLIALSGALAVIFILVGAIFYVVSTGDPGRLKQAKDILTNTVVGLMVILVSYAVVTFIANGLS